VRFASVYRQFKTLEELVEVFTWSQLGLHAKPVALLNVEGYYEGLIDFLDHVDSEYLYLVGDIIDGWRMKKRFYWPERHNAIVRRIMKRAKRGTQVIYVPGNHDEMFRQFAGMNFGGVEIRLRATHTTADGRKLPDVYSEPPELGSELQARALHVHHRKDMIVTAAQRSSFGGIEAAREGPRPRRHPGTVRRGSARAGDRAARRSSRGWTCARSRES